MARTSDGKPGPGQPPRTAAPQCWCQGWLPMLNEGNRLVRWTEPYLETCCRSALHRLILAGPAGRPPALKDGACLARLLGMGLAAMRPDGRYSITKAGEHRHDTEIMHERLAEPHATS